MNRLVFQIQINAAARTVYDRMLGLSHKADYKSWTAIFNPTSNYEGKWEKGEKIYFIGTDENGNTGGMISRIAELIPERMVSIQHIGMLAGDQEILEGPAVEEWMGALENYYYEANPEGTLLRVELDSSAEHEDYFRETYPRALQALKELCENQPR